MVTLRYPFEPRPAPDNFRGQPYWDHHKCIGCGGCAAHCPARTILVRDLCQELRVMVYDARAAPTAVAARTCVPRTPSPWTPNYELATGSKEDINETMSSSWPPASVAGAATITRSPTRSTACSRIGFKYDSIEMRAVVPVSSEQFDMKL